MVPPVSQTSINNTNVQVDTAANTSTSSLSTSTASTLAPAINPLTLTNHTLSNGAFNYQFNNDLSVVNLVNPNAVFDFHSLSDAKNPLKIQIITDFGPLDLLFQMEQNGPNHIVGKNVNYGVTYSAHILENGKVNFSLSSDKAYKFRFLFSSSEKKLDNGQIRQFAIFGKDITHIAVTKAKEEDGTYKWFGIDYNYHLFALVLKDKTVMKYKSSENGQFALEFVSPVKDFSGDLVFTKKNYDHLVSLGDGLHLSVDFGFFAILAVPILRGLQFIHRYIPNYGIAIDHISTSVQVFQKHEKNADHSA
jgi:YidC/Oxa1 family membrane protein insertase